MDLESIKKRMQPQTTNYGTVINLPCTEEVLWLVREVERLSTSCKAWELQAKGYGKVIDQQESLVAHLRSQISSIQSANECNYKGKLAAEADRNRFRSALERIFACAPMRRDGSNPVGWAQIAREALSETTSSHPLDCRVEGKRIAVYIGFDELVFASAHHPDFWDGESGEDVPNIKVTDPATFALEVVRQLNRESEDGSTPVTRLLDKAIQAAVEDGCEGIEE